jgi:hypothetical protein
VSVLNGHAFCRKYPSLFYFKVAFSVISFAYFGVPCGGNLEGGASFWWEAGVLAGVLVGGRSFGGKFLALPFLCFVLSKIVFSSFLYA